jgi:hypothetical protein
MKQTNGEYDFLFGKTKVPSPGNALTVQALKLSCVARSAPEDGLTPACRQRSEMRRPMMARGPGGDIAQVIQLRSYIQQVEVGVELSLYS